MTDIICAKCGKHFNSIEAAREHQSHCKGSSSSEPISLKRNKPNKVTKDEWQTVVESFTHQSNPNFEAPITSKNKISNTEIDCPECGRKLLYISEEELWKCGLCRRAYTINDLQSGIAPLKQTPSIPVQAKDHLNHKKQTSNSAPPPKGPIKTKEKAAAFKIPIWLIALLLVFVTGIMGIVINLLLDSIIPFWLLIGFAVFFSIERWYRRFTTIHKSVGKLYRLFLNLSFLLLLGTLIWTAVGIFSSQRSVNPVYGSILFVGEFVLLVWLWRIVLKNRWRWPSMKLTIFSLVGLFLVVSFAGVEPFSLYKDKGISYFATTFNDMSCTFNQSSPLSSDADSSSQQDKGLVTSTSTSTATSRTSLVAASIKPGNPSLIDRSNFSTIDAYAVAAPDAVTKSINDLADYLIEPTKNDVEKARAIYRWITQNIVYDYSGYLTGNYKSTSAGDVLQSRSSVCQGYSSLFSALAKAADIEVVLISGWAKGISYEVGESITGRTNHAWNAVKIDGAWYLIDSTWGAGNISGGQFVRDFDDNYFFTPPESFIYNHLPEDSKWQLLPKVMSKTEYSALPYVYSNFFSSGISLGENTNCVIHSGSNLSMNFPVASNTFLMANLYRGNVELSDSLVSAVKLNDSYRINIKLPEAGEYILRIYARTGDQYGMYDGVLEYKIMCDKYEAP